jgi:hypothetical protein
MPARREARPWPVCIAATLKQSISRNQQPQPLHRIPKEKYFPVPGVDGALVTFKLRSPAKRLPVNDERGFVSLVRRGTT